MMNHKSCCVDECKSSSTREQDRGVTFHRLAKEGAIRQAWVTQGRLQHLQSQEEESGGSNKGPSTSYICSRHFRKVDFELKIDKASKFVLKPGAIPTIFPWGVTQLEDLPKLFPDVIAIEEQPESSVENKETIVDKKTSEKKEDVKDPSLVANPSVEESDKKEDAGKPHNLTVTETPSVASRLDSKLTKEGYSSSADTESDKDAFEGNLVIDEAAFNQPEPSAKKRKRRRTSGKPTVRKIQKPKVGLPTNPRKKIVKQGVTKSLQEVSGEMKAPVIKQPQARRARGPRKKRENKNPLLNNPPKSQSNINPAASGVSNKVPSLSENPKLSSSPMLRALIEKPNTPMVPPRTPINLLEVSEKVAERKVPMGNEKAMMVPGAIVEAKDFSEQWYPAKIVEVDHDEKEVLIHYDNWSQRYDEWISMASPRLRLVAPPARCPRVPSAPTTYCQGERCLARWSDNRRFPATIQAVLADDKYKVLFDDGFVRVMKWQHLAKGQPSLQSNSSGFSPLPYGSRHPAPALPAAPSAPPPPPLHTHLFDPHRDHLGSKEERRDLKRKINVKELFSSNMGKRKLDTKSETSGRKRFRRGSGPGKTKPQSIAETKSAGPPIGTPVISMNQTQTLEDIKPSISATHSEMEIGQESFIKQENECEQTNLQTVSASSALSDQQQTVDNNDLQTQLVSKPQERHSISSEAQRFKKSLNKRSSSSKQRSADQTTSSSLSSLKQQLLKQTTQSSLMLPGSSAVDSIPKKPRSRTMSPVVKDASGIKIKKEEIPMLNECIPLDSQDLSRLLNDEWSCKWVDNQPVGEVTVMPPLERGTRAVPAPGTGEEDAGERLARMTVKVADHRLPPDWSKFLTRRCVGNSAGKWDVVLMCPQGRRYRSRAEINARLLEEDGPSLLPYQFCLQDFSVHRKLARRLGWDTTSSGIPVTSPVDTFKKKINTSSTALKTELKTPEAKAIGTPKSRSDASATTPKIKSTPGATPRPRTNQSSSKQRSVNSTPRPRTSSGTPKPKQNTVNTTSVVDTPLSSTLAAVTQSDVSDEVTSIPSVPQQPPLEEGFIYVGSLKVEIIGTLLRCPKEGCFKNFRKDNLLQMHIKHYHSEMISLLGDTPNVADLAYARTIVEDVTPTKVVEKPHRVREKKPSLTPLSLKTDLDASGVKQEPSADSFSDTSLLELTPKKENIKSESLERSPKLRNLLLEPKQENSPSKILNHDVEEVLQTFKIKQDTDGSDRKINRMGRAKHSKATKPDKELTKSQVMALINKIAEEGDRSRSQSPVRKQHDERSDAAYEGSTTDNTSFEQSAFPPPPKTKKKRRRHVDDNDADFKPSTSSSRKKKSQSSYLDIWNAYVTNNSDDTRSSFGTPSEITTGNASEVGGTSVETSHMDVKPESNQTFINDNGEKIKIVHMKREEIINCYCGIGEEDGLMIQCELCLCWQHAMCHGIEKESQVPDKYICHICLYPPRGRKSQRHLNNQDWLYEGRLTRVEHQASAADPNVLNGLAPLSAADQGRAQALKKSHQLCGNLLHVAKILHSLRCKIEVSQKKDHPKLYLWSKAWDDKTEVDQLDHNGIHSSSSGNIHPDQQQQQQDLHHSAPGGGDITEAGDMGDGEDYHLDGRTEEMIANTIGPYGDINMDEVKLEVGESIEVSEVNEMEEGEMLDKCEEVMGLGEERGPGGLLSSPGGTPIHLPITNMELKTLVKSVEVCAPQPEAAIDPSECRQRLLQHIENLQMLVDARLDSIEAQIAELESQDPSLADDETPESYPRTKQTLTMLIRDLQTLEELGTIV